MNKFIVLATMASVGLAYPAAIFGDSDAIYGRLQRNSYVPYPKPDYKQLYLALKNGHAQDQDTEQNDYEYEPSRPIGAIFEPHDETLQYDDGQNDLPNQQWLDIGTLYDKPIDEEDLEQQSEVVRQLMSNYIEKKSQMKKVDASAPKINDMASKTVKTASTTTTTTTTSTTKAPQKVKEHREDKIPQVSKLHGQKEYAMLRPAGAAEARRALPELWTGDADVQELKRAARRFYRKTPMDKLTSQLDSLKQKE